MEKFQEITRKTYRCAAISNTKKAEIIEMFVCHKDNSVNKIAAVAKVTKHHTYHIIEMYLKSIALFCECSENDRFITINSKMNTKNS